MAKKDLRERLREDLFLLDGAMGTELFARGIQTGKCVDYLNVSDADIVLGVHRAYIDAGSDAVLTNTFGANRYTLARHGLEDKTEQINQAGASIARRAAGEDKYVLGDIGPTGDFLQPLGSLKSDELKEAFIRQARGLLAGGVDGFIIETMSAIDEVLTAVEAVREVCKLPVFASMAFNPAGGEFKTMMGIGPEESVARIVQSGVDGVGFNCGSVSLDGYIRLAQRYVSTTVGLSQDVIVFAELNAGQPELVDGKAVYKVLPDDFLAAAEKIYSAGVKILGGCCGTTPQHITALARGLKK